MNRKFTHKFCKFILVSTLILASSNLVRAQNGECGVFMEKDGRVIIEVESAPPTGEWAFKTDLEGYTGKGYYEWEGPNHFHVPGNGLLQYKIYISTPGLYRFQIRSFVPGPSTTEHNDVWMRVKDKATILKRWQMEDKSEPVNHWNKVYHGDVGHWVWHSNAEGGYEIHVELEEGFHTLELSGRSTGYNIDRMVLYRQGYVHGSTNPELPESEFTPCHELNWPPVVKNGIPDQTAYAGTAFTFTFEEDTFEDPDGDDLTYAATTQNEESLPEWLEFNAETRTFSGTPLPENLGEMTIVVTASDPENASASTSFNLKVIEQTTTGLAIDNNLNKNITIFPNPVKNDINIDFGKLNPQRVQMTIYNLNGEKLNDTTYQIQNNTLKANMEGLDKGTYLIYLLIDDHYAYQGKVIK
jgi:hypothetical protein